MYGFIYLTTNKINGKKYIGMCKYTHEKGYIGSGKILKEAISKYGKDSFERITLEECETFEQLCESEKRWIERMNAVKSEEYYNICHGGFGGCSESMKDYWNMFTDDERKVIRNWYKRDLTGNNNPMFGKKHSEETKQKIGAKSVNRNWGRKTPINGCNNPKAIRIDVIFDDGKIERYGCIKDFSTKYGYNYSTMKSIHKSGTHSKRYGIKIVNA